MCAYSEIEQIKLDNGKTIREINDNVRKEVEKIYLECWAKNVSVPFFDRAGNTYLANPDGSEDLVKFDKETRTYSIISRTAEIGHGRFSYLLH